MIEIRLAAPRDAAGIAAVMRDAWPKEGADAARIEFVLLAGGRATFVAVAGGAVVGFVDGFWTVSADGARRWEVDLLAVAGTYRGQRLGERLVRASTEAGQQAGAHMARALIHLENAASQRTFARCRYEPDLARFVLLTSTHPVDYSAVVVPDARLISVTTFRYAGLWLEGTLGEEAFRAGRAGLARQGREVVGALVEAEDTALRRAAEAAGYTPVGEYRWWLQRILSG